MASRLGSASIRTHLVVIIVVGAILPMAAIGTWLTWKGVRSGRELLVTQLDSTLVNVERSIASRWTYRRGDLLLMADNESARRALQSGRVSPGDSAFFAALQVSVAQSIPRFAYRDSNGMELYSIRAAAESPAQGANGNAGGDGPTQTVDVSFPVTSDLGVVGSLHASVDLRAILPFDYARLLLPGSALAVRDAASGSLLMPIQPGVEFPSEGEVLLEDGPWMARVSRIAEPQFELAVAAPLAPYVVPFEQAGRFGLAALATSALLALIASSLLTRRLARSVDALVDAAGAVAGGDLSRQAAPTGPAEFQKLAGAFNAMTDSLRSTMAELSQRRALAAVGEFAASLSHEVRNALTSVQIDLDRVDERSEDEKNRILLARALAHVRRLDAAVTGSLRVARSGTVVPQDVDLPDVLREAIAIAEPSFRSSHTQVKGDGLENSVVVRGDPWALQQLFVNLLLNAQQALPHGGDAAVSIRVVDKQVVVTVADSGTGMSGEQVARAFDPYYTTRPNGTGLGLPIARQIALAHGGDLRIESQIGTGTLVEVSLPASVNGCNC